MCCKLPLYLFLSGHRNAWQSLVIGNGVGSFLSGGAVQECVTGAVQHSTSTGLWMIEARSACLFPGEDRISVSISWRKS